MRNNFAKNVKNIKGQSRIEHQRIAGRLVQPSCLPSLHRGLRAACCRPPQAAHCRQLPSSSRSPRRHLSPFHQPLKTTAQPSQTSHSSFPPSTLAPRASTTAIHRKLPILLFHRLPPSPSLPLNVPCLRQPVSACPQSLIRLYHRNLKSSVLRFGEHADVGTIG